MPIDQNWQPIVDEVAAAVAERLRDDPPLVSPWMTPEQAAQYMGFTERGLETMRREGRGPAVTRVNARCIRYHRDDLDTWLNQHREGQ